MSSLSQIDKQYKRLFDASDETEDEGSNRPNQGMNFYEKWSWITTVDMLSNNNPLLWDEIFNWNVIKFLNIVMYYKDKQDYLNQEQRRNQIRYGLK